MVQMKRVFQSPSQESLIQIAGWSECWHVLGACASLCTVELKGALANAAPAEKTGLSQPHRPVYRIPGRQLLGLGYMVLNMPAHRPVSQQNLPGIIFTV